MQNTRMPLGLVWNPCIDLGSPNCVGAAQLPITAVYHLIHHHLWCIAGWLEWVMDKPGLQIVSDRAPDVRQVFAPTSGRRAHSCAPIQTRTGALYACRRGHFTSADCSTDSTAFFTDSVLLGMRGVGLPLWKGCVLPPAYMTSV